MSLFGLLVALLAHTAMAADEHGQGAVSLTGGVGQIMEDGTPVSPRFGVAGEFIVYDDAAIVSLLLPLEIDYLRQSGLGVVATRTSFELPLSVRIASQVTPLLRPALDVGVGPALVRTEASGFGFTATDTTLGWVARAAVGAQIGAGVAGSPFLVVEPAGLRVVHASDNTISEFVAQIGVGVRL